MVVVNKLTVVGGCFGGGEEAWSGGGVLAVVKRLGMGVTVAVKGLGVVVVLWWWLRDWEWSWSRGGGEETGSGCCGVMVVERLTLVVVSSWW